MTDALSTDTPNEDPGLDTLDRYRFVHTEIVRYSDQDPQKHVNNVAFVTYCEGGRVAWMRQTLGSLRRPGDGIVTAKLTIDYLREIHFPGSVAVGTRLLSVGRSSVTLGQGLFQDGVCRAVATTVLVLFDLETRRSKPFPAEALSVFETLIREGATPAP
jgi:acyl-CoA thioester hydrolase